MNRLCAIIGATGILGSEVTRKFHKQGYSLLLVGRSGERLARLVASLPESSSIVRTETIDFSVEPDPTVVFKDLDYIDVLVNAAGEQGPIGPSYTADWEKYERTIRVNFFAPARLCHAAIPLMTRPRGKIINIAGGGATSPRENFSAYACSKVSVVRFTEILAMEVASRQIDVNAVSPGMISSGMTDEVIAAGIKLTGDKELDAAIKIKNKNPNNERIAAELIAYLASPQSDGISGRLISALWDKWRDLHSRRDEIMKTDLFTLRRVSE